MNRNKEVEEILHTKETALEAMEARLEATEAKLQQTEDSHDLLQQNLLEVELVKNGLEAKVDKKRKELADKEEEIVKLRGHVGGQSIPNIDDLHEKFAKLESKLEASQANLRKSHLCIQGFAKENGRSDLVS